MADSHLQNGHRSLAQDLQAPSITEDSEVYRTKADQTRKAPTERTTTILDDQAGLIDWSIRCQSEKTVGPHSHLYERR